MSEMEFCFQIKMDEDIGQSWKTETKTSQK